MLFSFLLLILFSITSKLSVRHSQSLPTFVSCSLLVGRVCVCSIKLRSTAPTDRARESGRERARVGLWRSETRWRRVCIINSITIAWLDIRSHDWLFVKQRFGFQEGVFQLDEWSDPSCGCVSHNMCKMCAHCMTHTHTTHTHDTHTYTIPFTHNIDISYEFSPVLIVVESTIRFSPERSVLSLLSVLRVHQGHWVMLPWL